MTGFASSYFARLSSTGLIDTTFTPRVNNKVNAIALQPDGSIIVGGQFSFIS